MKKLLLFLILSFSLTSLYAFDSEYYVIEELKNIAEFQTYEYQFYAGVKANEEAQSFSEKELIEKILLPIAINTYKNTAASFNSPRNISEAKLLAKEVWTLTVYISMRLDLIIRERKY